MLLEPNIHVICPLENVFIVNMKLVREITYLGNMADTYRKGSSKRYA